jgi:hypothetical protein
MQLDSVGEGEGIRWKTVRYNGEELWKGSSVTEAGGSRAGWATDESSGLHRLDGNKQGLKLLVTIRAAVEVITYQGERRLGIFSGQGQFDERIQLLKARLTSDLIRANGRDAAYNTFKLFRFY